MSSKYDKDYREKENARIKAWKDSHPEEVKESNKRYRDTHKTERSNYNKMWAEAHREHLATKARKYYQADPDKFILRSKIYNENHIDKVRERHTMYRKKDPQKTILMDKAASLRRFYGITIEEYETMVNAQNGNCAICGRNKSEFKTSLHVDHDHKTGKIRGLLCSNCNSGIGNLRDDVSLLKKAINYLEN